MFSCLPVSTERVYVVVPVHNRRDITVGFTECIRDQTHTTFQMVLVDDGSTDGTAEAVLRTIPGTVVVRGTGDWWWARSLQRGLDWVAAQHPAPDDVVLFINDDVSFGPRFLESALESMRGRERTMILARFASEAATGVTLETGVHADFGRLTFETAESQSSINCLSTRGLFARWEDVEIIGGFRPTILPHYLSDYEYTIRAHRRGIRCATDDRVALVPRLDTTGIHSFEGLSLRSVIPILFSRRSSENPLAWTAFVIVASPWQWKVVNVYRVWRRVLSVLIRSVWPRR